MHTDLLAASSTEEAARFGIMERTAFSLPAFILSLVVFLEAALIFIAEWFALPEGHPFGYIAIPFILIASLPEMPLARVGQMLGFPVVLPSLALLFSAVGQYRKEAQKELRIAAVILTCAGIGLLLIVRHVLS